MQYRGFEIKPSKAFAAFHYEFAAISWNEENNLLCGSAISVVDAKRRIDKILDKQQLVVI